MPVVDNSDLSDIGTLYESGSESGDSDHSNVEIPEPGAYHSYYSDNYESDDGLIIGLNGYSEDEYDSDWSDEEEPVVVFKRPAVENMESALDYYESSFPVPEPKFTNQFDYFIRSNQVTGSIDVEEVIVEDHEKPATQVTEIYTTRYGEGLSVDENYKSTTFINIVDPLEEEQDIDDILDDNSISSRTLSPSPSPKGVAPNSPLYSPPRNEFTPINPKDFAAQKTAKQAAAAKKEATRQTPSKSPSSRMNTPTLDLSAKSPLLLKKRKPDDALSGLQPAAKKPIRASSNPVPATNTLQVPISNQRSVSDKNVSFRGNDVPTGYTKEQWARAWKRNYSAIRSKHQRSWKNLVSDTCDEAEAKKLAAAQGLAVINGSGYTGFKQLTIDRDLQRATEANETLDEYLIRLEDERVQKYDVKKEAKEVGQDEHGDGEEEGGVTGEV